MPIAELRVTKLEWNSQGGGPLDEGLTGYAGGQYVLLKGSQINESIQLSWKVAA